MPSNRLRSAALVLLATEALVVIVVLSGPLRPLLPGLAAGENGVCAQDHNARKDALAIAFEEAKRAGFTGPREFGSPRLINARPVIGDRLPEELAQRDRSCLWIVHLGGERPESRFALGGEPVEHAVRASRLRLVVDIAAGEAVTSRVQARR